MAADVVIRAEGLGKKYVIGHQAERERYVALRDVLARNARALARSARDILAGRPMVAGDEIEEFWALRDIDFEIRRGEVVGVVGRNGAGKSTLLKVLSRITEPSEGRVEIHGRVASLLEVGTGFHPELTGRENIFLNGAILGMGAAEIRRKFDEIVAFAEVEKFLDTPVKRYSSGMYVRLAFAVAAHLEPEILIVDEVLAVGDAEFQKKCLGKMGEVAGHGRTVLFVSHNMGAVRSLCQTGLLLGGGRVQHRGAVRDTLARYAEAASLDPAFRAEPSEGAAASIVEAEAVYFADSPEDGARIDLRLKVRARTAVSAAVEAKISDPVGAPTAYGSVGVIHSRDMVAFTPGEHVLEMSFDASALAPGAYSFTLELNKPFEASIDRRENCLRLVIDRPPAHGQTRQFHQSWGCGSVLLPVIRFERTA